MSVYRRKAEQDAETAKISEQIERNICEIVERAFVAVSLASLKFESEIAQAGLTLSRADVAQTSDMLNTQVEAAISEEIARLLPGPTNQLARAIAFGQCNRRLAERLLGHHGKAA